MTLSIDVEVAHLDRACCEGIVTHLWHSTGQHVYQRGLADIGSAHQRDLHI